MVIGGLVDLLAMHFYDVRWKMLSFLNPQDPQPSPPGAQITIGGPN